MGIYHSKQMNKFKKKILLLLLPLFMSFSFIVLTDEVKTLEIGQKAPLSDLKMKDVSGREMSMSDAMNKNGLLIIFSCNTCPFVIGRQDSEGWEGRYNEVADLAAKSGITTMLVNSNEAKRNEGDSFEDMVERAKSYEYKMHYVLDANHLLADAFGARTTPHVFLFNAKFELVYKGAIDDNNDSASGVKESWLKNALSDLSAGKTIDPNSTRNIGCSIKRVKKD